MSKLIWENGICVGAEDGATDEYKEKSIGEIVDYLQEEEIGHIQCDYEKVELLLYCVKEKAKEIERLKDIINKAIEYIESYMPNYGFDKTNLLKLLGILQGSDKND